MESSEEPIVVELSQVDVWMICEALDTYEYWELGLTLPRNNGAVFIPGDSVDSVDPYWDGRAPTEDQLEAIDLVISSRALAARILKAARQSE